MMRVALAFLCVLAACRDDAEVRVARAAPEHVEIVLGESGDRLMYRLPDGWRRVETEPGLVYASGERSLRVEICLKESSFETFAARARERGEDAEIREFRRGTGWPFVGVVVAYRGPADTPMLDAFVASFIYERR